VTIQGARKRATLVGATLTLLACEAPPSLPAEVQTWLDDSEFLCFVQKPPSSRLCMESINEGAKIAAAAFRKERQQETRACVEASKHDGHVDLASARACIIARTGVASE
jgi:hypothetical protein